MSDPQSNVVRGIDSEQIIANIDDVKVFGEDSFEEFDTEEAAAVERVGRRLGEITGRAFGEALGGEIGASLAPLFAGSNELTSAFSTMIAESERGKTETESSDTRRQEASSGASASKSETTDSEQDDDEANASRSTEQPPESEAADDGEDESDDDSDADADDDSDADADDDIPDRGGPTADDDERDAWGRRNAGLDWPLPPESRLPQEG